MTAYLKIVYISIFIQTNNVIIVVIYIENTNKPLILKKISTLLKIKKNTKECKNVIIYDPLKNAKP